jgi:SAM-dependent methyltransferase
MQTLLNVGAGKHPELPPHYAGWRSLGLDVDPDCGAEVVCDARFLHDRFPPASYDAIYCCHNLEHYFPHEGERVLRGFAHVLKSDGFAEIRVPDVGEVIRTAAQRGLDLDDVLYVSPTGPIRVLDVLYGWQVEIALSGKDFYAHKTGFTANSLRRILLGAGFEVVHFVRPIAIFELRAFAFKKAPSEAQIRLLQIDS